LAVAAECEFAVAIAAGFAETAAGAVAIAVVIAARAVYQLAVSL
jgi:hypothetical protein